MKPAAVIRGLQSGEERLACHSVSTGANNYPSGSANATLRLMAGDAQS